jgi:hypothetical protein
MPYFHDRASRGKAACFSLFLAGFAAKNCVQIGTKLMRNLRFAFLDAAEKNSFAGFFSDAVIKKFSY